MKDYQITRNEIVKRLGKDFQYTRIEKINTENPILYIEIDEQIEKSLEAMTKLKITSVYAMTSVIDYLENDVFNNIEKLSVSSRGSDLKSIKHLKNLTSLSIYTDKNDVLDLSNFPKLVFLRAHFPESMTVKNIEALEQLKTLELTNYTKDDLSDFSKLSKLKKLELSNPSCKTLNGISNLKKLTSLKIESADGLESISGIEALSEKLTTLEISSFSITDLSALGKLKKLKTLKLQRLTSIDDLSFISQLKNLKSLRINQLSCKSLDFISDLKQLKTLSISPWNVRTEDKSFLPVTQKLVELGKLKQIIQWEGVAEHLDEAGLKIYNDFFGVSKLEFIKREFHFLPFEEYTEPYTKENCDLVHSYIYELTDVLEQNKDLSEKEKMKHFKKAVLALNKLDKEHELIETGEREYLCDVLDDIAIAVAIDVEQFEDGIASVWRTW